MTDDTYIQHDDGSAALHTSDGAWIDFAPPGPSHLDRLAADAALKEDAEAALEEWRKSRPTAPWYVPVLGAAIWVAALGALVAAFLFGLKWYLRSQGI